MIINKSYQHFLCCFALVTLLYMISCQKWTKEKEVVVKSRTRLFELTPSFGSQLKSWNTSSMDQNEKLFVNGYLPIMINRVNIVGEYCHQHPERKSTRPFKQLIWIIREKQYPNIVWCPNLKVGSGTWAANFLRVAHFNENNPRILALPKYKRDKARFDHRYGASYRALSRIFPRPKSMKERKAIFRSALRILVVRHPFTRVLSAYRNKIQLSIPGARDEALFASLRKNITTSYRPENSSNTSEFPSFVEFVQWLTEAKRSGNESAFWSLKGNNYWEPFWFHCRVCSSDYSMIIKLETMAQDERFLAIWSRLTELKEKNKIEWRHTRGQSTSFDLAEKYFRQLTKQQVLDLYAAYKPDFEIFDYDIEKYLKLF